MSAGAFVPALANGRRPNMRARGTPRGAPDAIRLSGCGAPCEDAPGTPASAPGRVSWCRTVAGWGWVAFAEVRQVLEQQGANRFALSCGRQEAQRRKRARCRSQETSSQCWPTQGRCARLLGGREPASDGMQQRFTHRPAAAPQNRRMRHRFKALGPHRRAAVVDHLREDAPPRTAPRLACRRARVSPGPNDSGSYFRVSQHVVYASSHRAPTPVPPPPPATQLCEKLRPSGGLYLETGVKFPEIESPTGFSV